MIKLNSPIKPPLMINEGKQAVPGKDSSYLSETPIWGQSDSLYRSLSPSINSLQAKETLKQTDPSTASAPYGGEFEVCRNQIPKRRMYVPPHKLADSNSEIQAPSSVLLEAQHLVTDLDPYSCYHKKSFIKANVYLNKNPSVFPFPPPFIRSDWTPSQEVWKAVTCLKNKAVQLSR